MINGALFAQKGLLEERTLKMTLLLWTPLRLSFRKPQRENKLTLGMHSWSCLLFSLAVEFSR